MRKLIVFVMLFCLMPQAWAERMRGTGVRDPVMAGLYLAGNELFVLRVNSDGELIVDSSGGGGGASATEVTLAALLAKVIAAPATEAKQDDLNALIVIIDAVLDTIKLDTAKISADQATETTSAAILAKLIAAPSTEAKQDDLNALIVIIDAVLDTIKLDTAKISSDQATETTVAAILAKLIAAPATEAKQDTGNSSLATIAGLDFATQTTLAAVLAKLLVAPATEAKQDTGNTSLATIAGLDFATQTTLAAILSKIIAAPATEAKQDTANTSLASIDGKDFSTETTSAAILSKLSADPSTATLQTAANVILATIDAVMDLVLLDTTEIIANTATATTGAHGTVTITTSATEIRPANADRISLLLHNAENVVVFTGFTGVTLAAGTPLSRSTVSADGKGGNITYNNTLAIFGIVSSGTADIRWTEESK